jgi:choline monooxygenase
MTITAAPETPAGPPVRYLLPAEAYFSAQWYEREQQLLFPAHWALIGYATDVQSPGDWYVGYCGATPVVLCRDSEGALRAFADPDDSISASQPTRLMAADCAGLTECAVDTWAGVIFAHLRPETAPPLMTWLGTFPSEAFVGLFPFEDLVGIDRTQWDLDCNWKFYIENHIDIYHLWYLHEKSLGNFDHHGLTCRSTGPHWSCVEAAKDPTLARRESLPRIPGVTDVEATLIRANLLFPNVPWTSTSGNAVTTYQVIPTGPETCRLDFRLRAVPGSVISDEDRANGRQILYAEDGYACEQMQRVVRAPQFGVGPLAQVHERPIMEFHQNLLTLLG